jgi:hypothetical protein
MLKFSYIQTNIFFNLISYEPINTSAKLAKL